LICVGLCANAVAQNTFDLVGLTSATPPVGGYSLRLLSSGYTGPLVRITIGSSYYDVFPDATTKNFALTSEISAAYGSFNASATGATSNALSSVLGSNSASVAIWYDQSGNARNVSQATTSLQPSIATAGVINLKNGAPTVYFNSQKLSSANFANAYNSAFSLALVAGVKNDLSINAFVSKTNGNQPSPFDFYNTNMLYGASGSFNSWFFTQGFSSANGFSQWTFTANNAGAKAFRNGVANNTTSAATSINDNLSTPLIFGSRADGNSALDGWISEVLTFNNVLSTPDQILIEANQAAAYPPPPTVTSFTPTSAGPGTTVTITGNYFNGAAAVSFGGVGAASFTVVSNSTVTAVVPAGASGSVSVTSPSGTGTLAGFAYTALVPPGNALDFDGANDFVEMIDNPSINYGGTSFTWEGWLNFTDSQPNYAGVLAKVSGTSSGVQLVLVGNKIAAEFFGGGSAVGVGNGLVGTTPLNDGRWHHVAMVLDATAKNMKLYVDGQVEATVNSPLLSSNIDNSARLFIGTERTAIAFFKGRIDEIRLYNTALTQANIQADMTSIAPSEPASLTSYFDFDEGSAGGSNSAITTLIDSKSFYHGNLKNFTLSGANSNWVESYALIVPTTVAATNITPTGFTANWSAPAIGSLVDYRLDVSTSPTFASFVSGYNGRTVSGLSQAVTGLTAGTTYYYRVRAEKTSVAGQGANSNAITINTLPAPTITGFTPTTAPSGAIVTITGTNFTGATAVSFGGTAATSFNVASATSITAVVAGGTSGVVSVTAPGGTVTSTGFVFIPAPTITSFTPTTAATGSTITITGTNFTGATAVSFGGTPATSFNVTSATSITAVVAGGTSGVVSVTAPGGAVTSSGFVFIPAPTITSFTPTSAASGATVTISGTNFTGATEVSFGGTPATSFNVASATSITAVVAGGTSGVVSVTTPGGAVTSSGFVFIPAPTITSFTPTSAASGATVTITGTNFTGATEVSFGGTAATSFDVASATNITAVVASGTSGVVSITAPGGTVTSAGFVFIPPPTITSFTPTSAASGATVTITGTNFTGATEVSFGGTAATSFNVASVTSITAVVAAGTSGVVSITTPGGVVTSAGFVFIPAPTITSFTPTSAISGASVTLTGANFTGATAVSFGGTNATSFTVDSDTNITAVVAAGSSGAVSVATPGGTVTSPGFVFIPPPSITSFTPTSAAQTAQVTITGIDFTDATSVSFGGTPASSFRVDSNTSIVATVAAGASGSILVTTPTGIATLAGFTFIPAPTITSFTPTSAVQGATITITGTNFNDATAVSFGGASASSFTVTSSTTITAVVGSGFDGSISVTAPGGVGSAPGFIFLGPPSISTFTPVLGTTGTSISISGSNFTGTNSVAIGGVPATSFTVNSSTSISAIVGSGASGSVTVVNPYGTATSTGFSFIGNAPTISSISPLSAGVGDQITITGTNFLGASSVSFGGVPAASFKIISNTSITAVVAAGATGNVSVANLAGSATFPGFSFIPAPLITSFSPTQAPAGALVTITGDYFTGVDAVFFGNTLATSFTVVSSTTITAIVGAGTSGSVSVSNSNGTAFKEGFVFFLPPTISLFEPKLAAKGETVVIKGANLTGTTSVSFGGKAATTFALVADSIVTAVVPEGETGELVVVSQGGTVRAGGFTFSPAPIINSFFPMAGEVGTPITIIGAGFDAEASNNSVFFGATRATVTAATESQLLVTVPAGATYAPITVLNLPAGLMDYSARAFTPIFSPVKGNSIAADFTKLDFTSSANFFATALGDVDGDGRPDLVFTSRDKNTVSILRNTTNNGVMTYAEKIDYATGIDPVGVALADLDGDGKLDISVVNKGSNTLSVFRNNSTTDISFATKVDLTTGTSPQSVAVGDFDADGKADLVVTNPGAASISIFQNASSKGNLSYAAKVDVIVGFGAYAVAVGDVTGDGQADVAVANASSGSVSVLRNKGVFKTISFDPSIELTSGINPISIALGDVDRDGRIDIAVANNSGNTVSIFRNTATLGVVKFDAKVDFTTGESPISVAFGDLDGDGKPDLLASTGSAGIFSLLRNTSSAGTLTYAAKVDLAAAAVANTLVVGDLDGDGKPDVAFGNEGKNSFSVFENKPLFSPTISEFTPTTAFSGATVTITGSNFDAVKSVRFGGVEAVSFEVVSTTSITAIPSNGASGEVSVSTAGGVASLPGFTFVKLTSLITSFTPTAGAVGTEVTIRGANFETTPNANVVFFGATKATATAAAATELKVVVPAGATYAPLTVLNTITSVSTNSVNNFTPSFSSDKGSVTATFFNTKVDITASDKPESMVAADLDGDGKVDLIATNPLSNSLSVFRNTSSNEKVSYAAKQDVAAGTGPSSVVAGDLDGDGKIDLAVANKGNATVSVFLNTSTANAISLATKIDIVTGINPSFLAIGDLDGDGKPDLATTNSNSNTVSVFRNVSKLGALAFNTKVDFATGSSPQGIAISDLDGDNRTDLAIANNTNSSLSILINSGAAGAINFRPRVDVASGIGPYAITVGDLDGDLIPDLSVATQQSDNVSIYRNTTANGVLKFATRVELATGKGPVAIALGDLDGDGKADLASVNQQSDNVSVFSNLSTVGSIRFSSRTDLATGRVPAAILVADADGDGKSDLVVSGVINDVKGISIVRNNPVLAPTVSSFNPTIAASGATVVITGTNLNGATSVNFGGTPATSFSVVSNTSISAIVAEGATGTVSVTTLGGTATLAGFTFIPKPTISSVTPLTAGAGSVVTIVGTNFTGASAVSFGSVAATSFTVVSATSITAIVPASAISGSVSVTTPGGNATLSGFVFVPTPTITSFTPLSAEAGATVTISGTNFTNVTAITFGGLAASSFTIVSPTSITAVLAAGASGNVAITSVGGVASLAGFTYIQSAPGITSFTPALGAVGASVTIAGTKFNPTASSNIVFFGATRAQVTSATATELKVTVPAGATYAPITVLNASNGLLGYSVANFTPTFTPAKGSITKADFSAKADFATGQNPWSVVAADMDGDGKVDFAVSNNSGNTLSLYRNTTAGGVLSYAEKIDVATAIGPSALAVADFDGDGKPDLAVANGGSNSVSVLRNASVQGTLSLSTKVDFGVGFTPVALSVADLDGDGKADLAVANNGSSTLSVLRNVSNGSALMFAPKADFATGINPNAIVTADFDNDGKIDLAVANAGSNSLSVLRSKSGIGVLDYEPKVDVTTNTLPYALAAGDVDGDGKIDIAVANNNSNNASIFKNTTTNGKVSFADKVDFKTGTGPVYLAMGDLDGDGKVDLAIANIESANVSILRNTSSSSQINYADKIDFATGELPYSVAIADFDGNGKVDLAAANFANTNVWIIRNNPVLTPVKADQTVSFGTLPDKKLADAAFALFATSSAGLPVSFTSANDKVTISASQVTIAKAGRAVIRASQTGNEEYNAAPVVERTFCIKPAKPAITIAAGNETVLTSNATSGNQWFLNGVIIPAATGSSLTVTQTGAYTVQLKVDDCASDFSDDQSLFITGDLADANAVVVLYPVPAKDWLTVSFEQEAGVKQLTVFDRVGRTLATQEASGKETQLAVGQYATGVYYLRVLADQKATLIKFMIE
jgi:hypothetical protein